MNHQLSAAIIAAVCTALPSTQLRAQGTLADYQRAYSLQGKFAWSKVKDHIDKVRWTSPTSFQYHLTTDSAGAWTYTRFNANGTITLSPVPFDDIDYPKQRRHHGNYGGTLPATATRYIPTPTEPQPRHWMVTDDERTAYSVPSPDSTLVAFVRDNNVFVATPDGSSQRQLTTDGTDALYYSCHIVWSPDSRRLAVCRVLPADRRYVYYVESSPADMLQPALHRQEYAKPGDPLIQHTPCIIDVATGSVVSAPAQAIANQYALTMPEWCDDSRGVRFEYNQRGHHLYAVYEMDLDGRLRTLIEEREQKYVRYSNNYRHDLHGDSLILWRSERDGFPHLYLFDTTRGGTNPLASQQPPLEQQPHFHQGGVVAQRPEYHGGPETAVLQLTSGEWCVRDILRVDEHNGWIYFTGCGFHTGEDPYNIHYYRVNLDATGFTDLTPEPANHHAVFNEDFTAFIDTYSTPDTPPVTVLRRIVDPQAAIVSTTVLATADISDLRASGWTAPEVFVAPGRDGVTPMWGIIQRPTNFDPSRKYPIIEYIYAGPGDSYTPKSFQPFNWTTTALAELGFIVVQLDAMGTSNRGKRFEEVCYKNLRDAGFPDRMAWIRAAAERYPYMDIDRVGIYGCSAGGQESTTAILLHPDFYKAAYSACGCHDNRMDKIWWNEQWMSYPVDSSYVACSNVENAHLLTRPLMLVVGELDDNVDPASTMQVANALIRAGKDFELVVIPGARHTMGEAFGEHKRFDFFVKNLIGVCPPDWADVKAQ